MKGREGREGRGRERGENRESEKRGESVERELEGDKEIMLRFNKRHGKGGESDQMRGNG